MYSILLSYQNNATLVQSSPCHGENSPISFGIGRIHRKVRKLFEGWSEWSRMTYDTATGIRQHRGASIAPVNSTPLMSVELPLLGWTTSPSARSKTMSYNSNSGNKYRYRFCKFEHKCLRCSGAHPLSACYRNRSPEKQQNWPSSPAGRAHIKWNELIWH